MKFHQLLVEIIKSILRLVDLSQLHAICKEFPENPIAQVLESIVYKEIFYGPRNPKVKIIQVSLDELYRLARGEIKTSVQRLRICADTKEGIDPGFYDLLRIAEPHPDFLEAIPNVDFEGFMKCFRQYAIRVSIDNIHGWTLHYEQTLDLDMVLPNLRMVMFDSSGCAKRTTDWPKSLTTMIFNGCTATIANEGDMVSLLDSSMIPSGLQTLKIWRGRLPKRVELPDLSTFPALIAELRIYYYAEFWQE